MSNHIADLAVADRASTAALLIDMQEEFVTGLLNIVREEVIEAQCRFIERCTEADIPLVTLEYAGYGYTVPALQEKIQHVRRKWTVFKHENSGFRSPELHQILTALKVRRLVLMGMNASFCVLHTAEGAIAHGYRVLTSGRLVANCHWIPTLRKDPLMAQWYRDNTVFDE